MIDRLAAPLAALLWTLAALALLATSAAAQHPIARLNCGGPGIAITGFGSFDADAAYGGAVDAGYVGGPFQVTLATGGAGVLDLPMSVPNAPLLADLELWIQVFTPGRGLSNSLGVKGGP
jgi:hypothetical protein